MRKFDWRPRHDPRSLNYPAVAGLEGTDFRSRSWSCDVWNDQENEGACVAFGWGHELCARPAVYLVDSVWCFLAYYAIQKIDEWPGEDYEGTSVNAGAKYIKSLRTDDGKALISEYRWAFGITDVLRVIGYKGPVVMGTNWYSGMWDTDSNGFVHPTGEVVGGHCVLIRAAHIEYLDDTALKNDFSNVDVNKSYVVIHNSWGRSWGDNGECKLTVADLRKLIKQDAEMCIPQGRNSQPPTGGSKFTALVNRVFAWVKSLLSFS